MVSPFRQLFARVTAMAMLSISAFVAAEGDDKVKGISNANSQPETPGKTDTITANEVATESPADSSLSPFPIGSRERPLIVRTFLPDLINDPQCFPNHRPTAAAAGYDPHTGGDTDAIIQPVHGMPAAIAVSFGDQLSIAWDSVECRLLYAWRGGFLDMTKAWGSAGGDHLPEIVGDLVYLASGPAPLSVSLGALEDEVKFYGYRQVDGVPEFLYTIGALKVAERIEPGEGGKTIVQHFNVERNNLELILSAPASAKSRSDDDDGNDKNSKDSITVINGERKGDYVIVTKNNAKDFTLIHTIGSPIERPDATQVNAMTIPLLTQNSKPPIKATPVVMPTSAPEPKSDKPTAAPEPKPKPEPKTMPPVVAVEPAAPSEPAEPIISRAERYDRDILLTDPEVEAGGLNKDSTAFVDRDFKFSELPDELIGADYVRTFDRDKYIPGDILSYRLQLEGEANVYLLFDKRLEPMPAWVDHRFKDTGKTAALDADKEFRVMHATANAGEFRFGPQDSGAGAHFYVIAVTPRGQKSESGSQ